jgi:serine protease Do
MYRDAAFRWFVACLAAWSAAAAQAQALPDFTALVEKNGPAVVNIATQSRPNGKRDFRGQIPPGQIPDIPEDSPLYDFLRRFFGEPLPGQPGDFEPRSSLGSGFIISGDGYVISNEHVVRGADEIIVRLSDRREFEAKVIGADARSDIAVLKIETDEPLPVLKLGKSADLKVGEWVVAIGSPFGLDYSVTQGIVSAKGRSLPTEGNYNYVPFIQTDVAINPGNSGGPLFNLAGEVVGVNSQIYSRTGGFMGLSFAIPIDVVVNVYEQLRDKGSVSRGWLGVLIQQVTSDLAESFGMERPFGALVSRVLPDSPAQTAGLQPGDIIVGFNGRPIKTDSDLPSLVANTEIGSEVPIEIIRNGDKQTLELTVGELPSEEQLTKADPGSGRSSDQRLDVSVRELTPEEREDMEIAEGGVLVVDVRPDGVAFDAGVRDGDVIMQLNNQKIRDVAHFREVADGLQPGKSTPLLIERPQQGPQFLALKVPD